MAPLYTTWEDFLRMRAIKLNLYARCGVRQYWIVDMFRRCTEVRHAPTVTLESTMPTSAYFSLTHSLTV